MKEYPEILGLIQTHVHPDADFKAGMAEIEDLPEDEIRVTVIATGLSDIRGGHEGLFVREANSGDSDALASEDTQTANENVSDPFSNNFNKNTFAAPAFFRRNRS